MIPLVIAIVVAIVVLSVHGARRRAAADRAWMAKAKFVEGEVANCELISRGDDEYYSWAVYYKVRNIAYQIGGTTGFTPADVGRKVRVAYNPKLPSDARLA
jgi:hypothetical protein